MAQTKLNILLQVRRDNVFTSTYVLQAGEPGFEISTNTLKIGDGVKTWADLDFANEAQIAALIKVTDDKVVALTEAVNKLNDTYATDAEVEAALLLKADKSVVDAMYTNDQIDGFIADAKKYADDNDADTKYGIAYDSDSKKITLVEGGTNFEIDATDFIKDGMIDTVTIGDDNDLVITFNTAAGKDEIRLPLDQLVDIYTGSTGDRIVVTVASDKSISAELVAGSISKNYLDSDVQDSLGKADNALQAADLADYAKTADVVTNEEFTAFKATNTEAIGKKLDANGWTTTSTGNGSLNYGNLITIDPEHISGKINDDNRLSITTQGVSFAADDRNNFRTANIDFDGIEITCNNPLNTEDPATNYTADLAFPKASGTIALTSDVATALQEAKDYAAGLDHEDTTYTVAATENALEFTVTPDGKGEAQTIKLVAPTVDIGVMSVEAGEDIVVTPGENGKVTVAHETFTTGTYEKTPESSDRDNDVYMMTAVTVDNGHVTGANVQSLAHALGAMTFILDGGTSSN